MMIATLKLVERYPDPLRQGFEEYLSGLYDANATIGRLEKVSFFPQINIHAEEITIHNKSNAALIKIDIQSFKVSAPFLSIFLNTGFLNNLSIQGLNAVEGAILPRSFEIKEVNIVKKEGPEQYGAFIIGGGTYDKEPMTFEAQLKEKKNGYRLEDQIPFSLKLGNAKLNAQIQSKGGNIKMLNSTLVLDNTSSNSKDYIIFENNKFNEENPLYCLLSKESQLECEKYLTE